MFKKRAFITRNTSLFNLNRQIKYYNKFKLLYIILMG